MEKQTEKIEETTLIEAFKLIGLPIRWQILGMLAEAGETGMTHYEICERLDRHLGAWPQLQRMTNANVITKVTYDSRDVRYTANEETIKEMINTLQNLI